MRFIQRVDWQMLSFALTSFFLQWLGFFAVGTVCFVVWKFSDLQASVDASVLWLVMLGFGAWAYFLIAGWRDRLGCKRFGVDWETFVWRGRRAERRS